VFQFIAWVFILDHFAERRFFRTKLRMTKRDKKKKRKKVADSREQAVCVVAVLFVPAGQGIGFAVPAGQ
jgi:flagellar biosynthesis protein FlhB